MRTNSTSLLSAALAAGFSTLLLTAAANAAPPVKAAGGAAEAATKAAGLPVVEVAKRRAKSKVRRIRPRAVRRGRIVRRRLPPRRRYYRRRALNRGIGIGIGIGIIAFIANQAANSEFQSAMRRCARNYRSFDWETGTYVTYGGRVRLCPYLRPYL